MRVRTGLSQAASSSWGSCRSNSPSTATRTRPAPAANARPSVPPRSSYRPQCARPGARVLPPAAKECLTPSNPAVPPPPAPQSGAGAGPLPRTLPGPAPLPAGLRRPGRVVPSERTLTQAPGSIRALTPESGQRGQTQPATPGRHFSPFLGCLRRTRE